MSKDYCTIDVKNDIAMTYSKSVQGGNANKSKMTSPSTVRIQVMEQVLITYKTRAHVQLSVTLLPQAVSQTFRHIYRVKMGTDRPTDRPTHLIVETRARV